MPPVALVTLLLPLTVTLSRPAAPEVWSHRCLSIGYGENHIYGCEEALNKGFMGVEVDVRCTLDPDSNKAMFWLIHDEIGVKK